MSKAIIITILLLNIGCKPLIDFSGGSGDQEEALERQEQVIRDAEDAIWDLRNTVDEVTGILCDLNPDIEQCIGE